MGAGVSHGSCDCCCTLTLSLLLLLLLLFTMQVIPRQLCDNAGFDATDMLNKLRQKHALADGSGKVSWPARGRACGG
jgi:hypothetical protein